MDLSLLEDSGWESYVEVVVDLKDLLSVLVGHILELLALLYGI